MRYKGNAAALGDTIGGQRFLMIYTSSTAIPQVRGGKLRALAMISQERSGLLQDVPTVA